MYTDYVCIWYRQATEEGGESLRLESHLMWVLARKCFSGVSTLHLRSSHLSSPYKILILIVQV